MAKAREHIYGSTEARTGGNTGGFAPHRQLGEVGMHITVLSLYSVHHILIVLLLGVRYRREIYGTGKTYLHQLIYRTKSEVLLVG